MRSMSLILMTAALAACTTAPEPAGRSAQAQAELQQLLAGRAAGPTMSCLPNYTARSGNMVVIDDSTIAFRNVGGNVYVNNVRAGGCARLASGFYSLVTRTSGSSLCSGDIAEVMDLSTGVSAGTCVLGDFVPYHRS